MIVRDETIDSQSTFTWVWEGGDSGLLELRHNHEDAVQFLSIDASVTVGLGRNGLLASIEIDLPLENLPRASVSSSACSDGYASLFIEPDDSSDRPTDLIFDPVRQVVRLAIGSVWDGASCIRLGSKLAAVVKHRRLIGLHIDLSDGSVSAATHSLESAYLNAYRDDLRARTDTLRRDMAAQPSQARSWRVALDQVGAWLEGTEPVVSPDRFWAVLHDLPGDQVDDTQRLASILSGVWLMHHREPV